jgi:BirA family biotin operon repressor/biotin-[acetyl-CoA-carboxylase] ligase
MMWMNLHAVEDALRTSVFGRRLVYLSSTGSTMDVARTEAEAGAPEGTLVIAEEQTAGRGRFQRTWLSPAGKNLYFTLILRPEAPRFRSLSIGAPLAVCQAVEEIARIKARIKWPNDVRVGERKLAGVLIEGETSGQTPRYALVGIGINVNYDVEEAPEIAAIATSLKRELGRQVDRELLLAAVLNRFESLYHEEPRSVLEAWRARLDTLGRRVRVAVGDETYEGRASGVDDAGNLLLELDDGRTLTLEAGEVTLQA